MFNQDKKELADKVLSGLHNDYSDKKFIELVKLYSDDLQTIDQGGNLGWFSKGDMVEEFETAAFSLNIGEISGVVRTKYGFHIIKVNNKDEEKIKARHILIRARTLDDVLKKEREKIRIWKFIKH